MKLAALLAALTEDQLEHLAAEHVRMAELPAKPALWAMLESTIKSFRFAQDFVYSRQPPTFAILVTLLEAPDHRFPSAQLRDAATATTERWSRAIDAGEILGRDDQLRLYRRVLYQARRSDMDINPSEAALLSVLRRELGIAQVEHFLIEHHAELREFWNREHAFLHELHALRSAGIVFAHETDTVLPVDVASLIKQALGIELGSAGCARLYGQLSNQDLGEALVAVQLKSSGSKEEKLHRLLNQLVQPRAVLGHVSVTGLKDLCREFGAPTSGTKEQLLERIVTQIASGRDGASEPEAPPVPPVAEPRALDEQRFKALFAALRGQQLAAILSNFPEARQSGAKDARTSVLWELRRSELTLLSVLTNRDLEETLFRIRLKIGGSKKERVDRIVAYFSTVDLSTINMSDDPSSEPAEQAGGATS